MRLGTSAHSASTGTGIEVNTKAVNGPGKVHISHERGRGRFQLLILVVCLHTKHLLCTCCVAFILIRPSMDLFLGWPSVPYSVPVCTVRVFLYRMQENGLVRLISASEKANRV